MIKKKMTKKAMPKKAMPKVMAKKKVASKSMTKAPQQQSAAVPPAMPPMMGPQMGSAGASPMMKKGGKVSKMKIKKAQNGYKSPWGQKTPDSTQYYHEKAMDNARASYNLRSRGASAADTKGYDDARKQALKDRNRQALKGLPGYDKNGFPVYKKNKMGGKTSKKCKYGC